MWWLNFSGFFGYPLPTTTTNGVNGCSVFDDGCFVCSEDKQEVLSDMRDELEENKSLVSKLRHEVSVQSKAPPYSLPPVSLICQTERTIDWIYKGLYMYLLKPMVLWFQLMIFKCWRGPSFWKEPVWILFDSKLVCKRIFKKFVRELNRKYFLIFNSSKIWNYDFF